MNTYIRTLKDKFGNLIFPRTRADGVFLMDNTTKLDAELDARDERIADPKVTPVDADFIGIRDSADVNKLKKTTWGNIKTTLKSYFDTQYNNYTLPTASTTVLGGVKVDGTSITITDGVITANADELDTTTLGVVINGAAAKTVPLDVDSIGVVDSAAANVIKRTTFTELKAFLKTYFDTLYNTYSHPTGDGNLHVPANSTTNNNKVLKANSAAGTYTWTDLGEVANGLTSKTTPLDADSIMIVDSAASNVGKKTTWTQIKAFLKTYFDGIYLTSVPNASTQVSSLGVGTSASGTSGEIRATNNITAYYSDARLKTFLSKIDHPIEKIMQLNGYLFIENAKAKELGYSNDRVQVGVSAQEVKMVLPEAVTEAPINKEYLTVWYDKLVPLLIEGMKAQQLEIEELKKQVRELGGN